MRISASALHGDMEQRARDMALRRFKSGEAQILVATDVAQRGLDVRNVAAVINFDTPNCAEDYVHRIGRTGRAGKKGTAHSILIETEMHRFDKVSEYMDKQFDISVLPPFSILEKPGYKPDWVTLQIDGGKKQKVRPGDILGALTGKNGIAGKQVGKINMFDNWAYVAVHKDAAKPALAKLSEGKLKGRSFRVRRIR
jgi:ATP-independent RNA helicase DbpA